METPASLLDRLRRPSDEAAWRQFVHLYTPLLYDWAHRRHGLQTADAADLVSEVFLVLLRELPDFRKDPGRRFRDWLGAVVRNKWIDLHRRRLAARLVEGGGDGPGPVEPDWADAFADEEYRKYLAARALQLLQARFRQAKDWKACWEQVVHGRPAPQVASELGMTVNEAYLAKSRGLAMLRHELQGLLDGPAGA
jgi:RNA polymerase sigma-70 factor (ECF subfamily)